MAARLGPFFVHSETRGRALAYVEGLLGTVPLKNGWQLASANGEATPDGIHYLLRRGRCGTPCAPTWPTIWATRRGP